jgi:hypothetical protein
MTAYRDVVSLLRLEKVPRIRLGYAVDLELGPDIRSLQWLSVGFQHYPTQRIRPTGTSGQSEPP